MTITAKYKRVAILTTGDELVDGDVLETNSYHIAQQLNNNGITTGLHLMVGDNQTEIQCCIEFLLQQHQALITIGGLGPTSDDRTRFAIGAALDRPLEFDQVTWQGICHRLNTIGIAIPDSNKQQALFPQGAKVIPNPRGTAAACLVEYKGKLIYMLPGPPKECLPLFQEVVLKNLQAASFSRQLFHKSWLLLGVSEGSIAYELDKLAADYNVVVGYRVDYPYLEVKVHGENQAEVEKLANMYIPQIASYIISTNRQKASDLILKHLQSDLTCVIKVHDEATGGLLQSMLTTPLTKQRITFNSANRCLSESAIKIAVSGLKEYWEDKLITNHTVLDICITKNHAERKITKKLILHGSKVRICAAEIVCWELLCELLK